MVGTIMSTQPVACADHGSNSLIIFPLLQVCTITQGKLIVYDTTSFVHLEQPFSGLSRDLKEKSGPARALAERSPGSGRATLDTRRVVPKPFLCCLGCVLRINVTLEGEPPAQYQVLCAVEFVFLKDISILWRGMSESWMEQSLAKNTPTAWCCHHRASLLV